MSVPVGVGVGNTFGILGRKGGERGGVPCLVSGGREERYSYPTASWVLVTEHNDITFPQLHLRGVTSNRGTVTQSVRALVSHSLWLKFNLSRHLEPNKECSHRSQKAKPVNLRIAPTNL